MSSSINALQQFIESDFLLNLEYHLSKSFKYLSDNNVKQFWCDGISIEENIYTQSAINNEKQIIAKAWLGINGQDIYKLVIKLDEHSFQNYLKGSAIDINLHEEDISNWLSIQPGDKTIEVRLS